MREVNCQAGLTDDQRRKNAEELIVKLSRYMNIEEDDEDEGLEGEEDLDGFQSFQ
jgi:hypothetical protein